MARLHVWSHLDCHRDLPSGEAVGSRRFLDEDYQAVQQTGRALREAAIVAPLEEDLGRALRR